MNYLRIFLAALGAFVAYFVIGGLSFAIAPSLKDEFSKYPAIYRTQQQMMTVMPTGMIAMFVAILALAVIYAMFDQRDAGAAKGAVFGALIGLFAFGAFVVHNYVNLNIGMKLTVQQGIAYFIEWTVVGIVIGLIYRPAGAN